METGEWNYVHAAKLAFQQMDRDRLRQGVMLDLAGFAPKEAPYRILHEEAGLRLRCYADESHQGPATLIVPAPIKRAYIWDLEPRVSVVRRFLELGFRVYMAEWLPAKEDQSAHNFGLTDFAGRLLGKCVDEIEADCRQRKVMLAGHSLGGTLATIFSCLYPERVRGLVLLEAPLHFPKADGKLGDLVAATREVSSIAESFGYVPGSFLNIACLAAAPSEFYWERLADLCVCASNREAFATHMRVERWTHDEFPLPGQLFTEVVELLYRNDCLMQGTLCVAGRQIGPHNLDVPLLSVADPRSTIIPSKSVIRFHEAAAGANKKLLMYGGDIGVALQHVGVLVGTGAHEHLWPAIFDWLSGVDVPGSISE
ncbi:MAG: poly[(R)-3-hydroxyalkanoate] polymerase subunit PhaC [Burkholderiales bacterium]